MSQAQRHLDESLLGLCLRVLMPAVLVGALGLPAMGSTLVLTGCDSGVSKDKKKKKKKDGKKKKKKRNKDNQKPTAAPDSETVSRERAILFLHHSTGENIFRGGVAEWFAKYRNVKGYSYTFTERAYPNEPYPWDNYPYDYWNIWVKNAGSVPYQGQDTLEILTERYGTIVFKHCFPVSAIEAGEEADVTSSQKTIPNYQAQYNALKSKLRSFGNTRFVVWTGAALTRAAMTGDYGGDEAMAQRAYDFFQWVKNTWDERGDNIFIFDFYELETEGGRYLKDSYAQDTADPHPNESFAKTIAPLLAKRVVDVIEGRGDTTSLTGR